MTQPNATSPSTQPARLDGPNAAEDALEAPLAALCRRVQPVEAETVPWDQAAGRVLAETLVLDRPSPACDVSAMDGYVVRAAEADRGGWPVVAEVQAGHEAQPLAPLTAARIFTGAMIPPGADAVVPREQVSESPDRIALPPGLRVVTGQHVRHRGENGGAGTPLARPGQVITPPMLAAAASCGKANPRIARRVRVGIIVTGGEVLEPAATPAPWQLRDGNGPALLAMLRSADWIDALAPVRGVDQPTRIADAVRRCLESCDALLLTGGVSVGDYDHVPAVLRRLGITIVFHKLPIRPGKPVLGAVDDAGRPIFGLPGNPVAVMVTARRFAAAALRARAGITDDGDTAELVEVTDTATAPAGLTWFPLVRWTEPGHAALVGGMGSGDWVSAAASAGFVQVPPGQSARGPRRLYRWSLADGGTRT